MLALALLAACGPAADTHDTDAPADPVTVRFATFNVSMFRDEAGALAADLADPSHEQARLAAEILQEVRPDVLLLNELDRDEDGLALARLLDSFLARPQGGREPLIYEHVFQPAVNTGIASGVDLNGDGQAVTTPGTQAYGEDALGFGLFPGQYGLAVLSRHPIDAAAVRTFRETLWRDVPDANLPDGFYSEAALSALPLSSKTHADVPIRVGEAVVHLLVSHPTPPSFDGPEDRNGRRNHDEIAFWTGYLDAGPDSWHVDDDGRRGGLDGASFVIAGDLNADPRDGGGFGDPLGDLLAHPRVTDARPASPGGAEQAALTGGMNARHAGDPALDTADFNDSTVGNLRVDHVLPSADLRVLGAAVFWPAADDPLFPLVGTFPFPVSDHRLVWVDVEVGG
jgi:alkaline phosphatase D